MMNEPPCEMKGINERCFKLSEYLVEMKRQHAAPSRRAADSRVPIGAATPGLSFPPTLPASVSR